MSGDGFTSLFATTPGPGYWGFCVYLATGHLFDPTDPTTELA